MTRGDLSYDTIVACYAQDARHCETAKLCFGEDVARMPNDLRAACEAARQKQPKETD